MASNYRPKAASYYFRETKAGTEWTLAKFLGAKGGDSEIPDQTYTLRCDDSGKHIWCDCPASWGGRDGSKRHCKHVDWLGRWRRLYTDRKVASGQIVYYNSTDDRFYPVSGLSGLIGED